MLKQLSILDVRQKCASDNMVNALESSRLCKSIATDTTSNIHGCGLQFLATKVKEHQACESTKFNKLSVRLIGSQAIALAQLDSLETANESPGEKVKRLVLAKVIEYLRTAGGLINKIFIDNPVKIVQLEEFCQLYFNLFAFFFPESVNVTVWTVGYAIPYHAKLLYEKYGIGFGILSLQAKESKHAGLKKELLMTNRSNKSDHNGNWSQLMRSNYIRSFYLPEHQPSPTSYTSHFKSRKPPHSV